MNRTLLFALTSILLASCFSYKELELGELSDINLNKASGGGVEIQAGLQVRNPNSYKIKVTTMEADLLVNGKKVGKVNLAEKVVLPKKSDQIHVIKATTQLSSLISAMPSLLFGGDISIQMKGLIKGKVSFLSKIFPIEVEQKVSAKDLKLF